MRKVGSIFLFWAIVCITLIRCSPPANPFVISNVNTFITVKTPPSEWITGDTIDIQIKVIVLEYVDSVSVHFGDSTNEMVKRDSLSDMGVIVVRHIYTAPGDFDIYTTIYLNNNSIKTTKPETITLKTHVTYYANGSTGGSVPKDSSVYAKGEKITVKGNTDSLLKSGFDFSGWNTKADGTGSNYNAGSDFIIGANNDLFARWTPSQTTTPKPENLTYPTNPATYTTGTPISANTPTWTGGTPTQFLANPPLPSGLVLNDVTGAITGTPSLTVATATYTITASNIGGFSQTSVILTINPVSITNRVPEFISGTGNISISENQTANITIVAHDSDMTDTIRWTLIKSPAADSVITTNPNAIQWNALRDTAHLTFAPGTRAGNYAFTIRISDRKDSASATITVSVGNVNRPPKWSVKDSSFSLKEGQAFSLPLKPLCTDQDGNAITFTLASGTPATDSLGSDGIYRYTPGFADAGSYTVKVAASDGTLTDTLSLTLTVANTNRKPVWTRPSITATITEGQLLTLPLKDSASDPDSDPLVFTLLSSTPAGDAISTTNAYTFTPSMADSGSYTVKISVSDGLLADTLTIALRVTNIDTDRTPPTLRRLDPATDSTIISANATQIKVIAKDSSGVASVSIVLGSTTFNASRSGDSVWTANITGLLPNAFNTITVTATDVSAGANSSQMPIRIKYDPTMTDNSGPTITPKNGIISDTMVRAAIITSTLEITDASGLDSLFWTMNGTFGGMLQTVSGQQDQYRLTDTLTTYHQNTIVVWAVDKSTNKNRRSVSFTINYNTLPSGVTAVAPVHAATGVENAGLKLVWRKSVDADGDGVSYVVKYGTDQTTLSAVAAVSDTGWMIAPAAGGNKTYHWQVLSVSGTDTTKSPSIGTFTFTTKNHPPTAGGRTPANGTYNISWQPTISWSASEPDGDAYRIRVCFGTSLANLPATDVGTGTSYQPGTLLAGTRYYWSVRVEESAAGGASFVTDTISFWTQAAVPTITVTSPALTRDSAYVTSASPNVTGSSGSMVGIQSFASSTGTVSGTSSWTLTGLSLQAKIWTAVTLTATSNAGDQGTKTVYLCYAPQISAVIPVAPTVSTLSDSSISLSWTKPTYCDSVRVFRSETNAAGSFTLRNTFGTTSSNDQPLSPCRTYYYQIRAFYRINGLGGWVDSTTVSQSIGGQTKFWFQRALTGKVAQAVRQTADGGYIIVGVTTAGGIGGDDIALVKTDVSGIVSWTRFFGSASNDYAYDVQELKTGGYVVVGSIGSSTNSDAYMVKTDGLGNNALTRTMSSTLADCAHAVIQTTDDGFLVVGTRADSIWVLKTYASMATQYERTFGKGTATSVLQQAASTNYLITGFSGVLPSTDACLIKTDALLTQLWKKTYGSSAMENIASVVQTTTGGYALCGATVTFSGGQNEYSLYLVKTDADGNTPSTQVYGVPNVEESGSSMIANNDGTFTVFGHKSTPTNGRDLWFLKFTSDFSSIVSGTEKTYGGTGVESAGTLSPTADGGFIMAGSTDSFSGGLYVVKTDASGNTTLAPK